MSRYILPLTLSTAMTSPLQTTFYPGSSFGFLPNEDHVAALCALDEMITQLFCNVALTKELFQSTVHNDESTTIMIEGHTARCKALDCTRMLKAKRSHHKASLALEHNKEACIQLRQLHLHRYIIATLKASFTTIRQHKSAHTMTLAMTTGINPAVRQT
jgi:hypothetical protein